MNGLVRVIQIIGVNSVPAFGVFGVGWTLGTAVAVYWLENVIGLVLVSLRLDLHRRQTRKRGHYNAGTMRVTERRGGETLVVEKKITYLRHFLSIAIPFTLAHGFFLAMLLFFIVPQNYPAVSMNVAAVGEGTAVVGVLLLLGFVFDLFDLRNRSFAWAKAQADYSLGRMLVVHLTIVLGMFALAATDAPESLFAVFIAFKTLVDLGSRAPKPMAKEPPKWLVQQKGRLPKATASGVSADPASVIVEQWDEQLKAAEEAELPMPEQPA